MGELRITPNEPVPLSVQLTDGNETKSIRAFVLDNTGAVIFQRNVNHVVNGFYSFNNYTMPNLPFITVQYLVYTDGTQTTIDTNYDIGNDVFYKNDSGGVSGGVASDVIKMNVFENEKIILKLKCGDN